MTDKEMGVTITLEQIYEKLEKQEELTTRIHYILEDNGSPGLKSQVKKNTASIEKTDGKLKKLTWGYGIMMAVGAAAVWILANIFGIDIKNF